MSEQRDTGKFKLDAKASLIRRDDVQISNLAPALLNKITDLLNLPEEQRPAAHARLERPARNPGLEEVTIVNKIGDIAKRHPSKPLPEKYRQMAMRPPTRR